MKYVDIAGARLSAIGLGTWQFGSTEWGYGADYSEREADAIVQRALDVGITLFDTAEIYGFGRSERILGKALGDRRDEAFIASKIFPVLPVGPGGAAAGPGQSAAAGRSTPSTCTSCTSPTRWCRCRRPCPPSRSCSTRGSCATSGCRTTRWRGGRQPRRRWAGRCCRTRCATAWSTGGPRRTCCPGPRPTTG